LENGEDLVKLRDLRDKMLTNEKGSRRRKLKEAGDDREGSDGEWRGEQRRGGLENEIIKTLGTL